MPSTDPVKEKILERVSIEEIVSQYVRLEPKGGRLFGLCPFHNEKTPSFSVSPDRGFYYCFGCGASGNAIDFVMAKETLTYPEARTYLAQKLNIPIEERRGSRSHQDIDRYQVMDHAARFFHKSLISGTSAREYLYKRGLTDQHINDFGLGLSLPGWDHLLNLLKQKNIPEAVMLELGLVISSSKSNKPYDRFRNRIMFPIRNTLGRVIAFGGRALDPDDNAKYLNTNDTPLFNKSKVLYLLDRAKHELKSRGAIVVEGYMDAISLHCNGFPQAVATLGTAITPDHVKILSRYTNNVVFLYDGDSAGIRAALRGVEHFFAGSAPVRVAILPTGSDPDDYVREHGSEAMQTLLDQASDGFSFTLAQTMEGRNPSDPADRQAIVDSMAGVLARIPEAYLRKDYIQVLAQHLGADLSSLQVTLEQKITQQARFVSTESTPEAVSQPPAPEKTREGKLRTVLLCLLACQHGFIIPDGMEPESVPSLFSQEDWDTRLPALGFQMDSENAIERMICRLLKSPPDSTSGHDMNRMETLLEDPQLITQFLHIINRASLPNESKTLLKMRDDVYNGFEALGHEREKSEILRLAKEDPKAAMLAQQELQRKRLANS